MTSNSAWQAVHGVLRQSTRHTITYQAPRAHLFAHARQPCLLSRRYAANVGRPITVSGRAKPRSRRALYGAGGIALLGVGAVSISDDAKHTYGATKRAARVAGALMLCINDYRVTLKLRDDPTVDAETYNQSLKACHKRCANRTLHVCERNGSVFIKLGQHLSSLNYLLPREWTETFIPLQDKCPVSSYESVENMIVHDTGRAMSEMFETFDKTPIAAASLAQVHLATLAGSGERVAVKVQHPSLAEWVKMDLSLTSFSFRMLKRFFPEYDLTWLSEEMEVSLPKELDFELEGRNAIDVKMHFASLHDSPPLLIPDVKWAQSRVLVMEYLPGHRLDDFSYLDAHNLDRDEISASLARIMNEMIFGRDAILHCDVHMGNIAIRARTDDESKSKSDGKTGARSGEFDIILYDHGLYRRPPPEIRLAYAQLWLAILDADEPRMRTAAWDLAGIDASQFPLFASAITGRDYSAIASSSVTKPRDSREEEAISDALGDGLIEQLIGILGRVPRVILLILKTNDLTRSLSDGLQTKQGPVRQFLILARYAARTVYEDRVRRLMGDWSWASWSSFLAARFAFERVRLRLGVYEFGLAVRAWFGLRAAI